MTRDRFAPGYDELPRIIPVFPLTGVLLLPQARLPLNIFEPRYLSMVRAALATPARQIGMIQPTLHESLAAEPAIYETGCAGRITQFAETDDGRYLITLSGLCRFDVVEELPLQDGFRRVLAEYRKYRADLDGDDALTIERDRLLAALRAYFQNQNLQVNWDAIRDSPDDRLVNSLAMMCPFQPSEKQALLLAPDLAERARMIVALLEFATLGKAGDAGAVRH